MSCPITIIDAEDEFKNLKRLLAASTRDVTAITALRDKVRGWLHQYALLDPANVTTTKKKNSMPDDVARDLCTTLDLANAELGQVTITLQLLHPASHGVLTDNGIAEDHIRRAVAAYLRRFDQGLRRFESDTGTQRIEQATNTAGQLQLFSCENHQLESIRAEDKQHYQARLSADNGIGYATYVAGADMLGRFRAEPVGPFARVFVEGPWRALLLALSDSSSVVIEKKADACVPSWLGAAYGGKNRVPWHALYTQAYKLCNFVYTSDKDGTFPTQRSLLPRHAVDKSGSGRKTWEEAVVDCIATRPCDRNAAKRIFQNLSVHGEPHAAVTGTLLKGLPGSGKTTVASQLSLAMGLEPLELEIGRLRGGSFVGDAAGVFKALFSRAHGEGGGLQVAVMDEVDLVANATDEHCKEQISQLLDLFTVAHKPANLTILASTNNDKNILGAICSRFSDALVVAAPQASTIRGYLNASGNQNHPFLRGIDGAKEVLAAASIGLTMRDIVNVPNLSAAASSELPLVIERQRKKGNFFRVGSLQSPTLFELLTKEEEQRPAAGANQAQQQGAAAAAAAASTTMTRVALPSPDSTDPLGDCAVLYLFLKQAAARGLLTGRLLVAQDSADTAFVDVEIRPIQQQMDVWLSDDPRLGGGRQQPREYRLRTGVSTRGFGPMPLVDVWRVLALLAEHIDAAHCNYVTQEFLDHCTGVVPGANGVDERRAMGLKLCVDFCLSAVPASVLVVPASFLFVDGGSGGGLSADGSAQNRGAHEVIAADLFLPSPRTKQLFTAMHTTTVDEINAVVNRTHFGLSSPLDLYVSASRNPFSCVLCGKPNVSDEAQAGCLHVPAGPSPFLTNEENLLRRQHPDALRFAATRDEPVPPYLTTWNPDGHFSFESVEKIQFPGCDCIMREPNFKHKCAGKKDKGLFKGEPIMISKTTTQEKRSFVTHEQVCNSAAEFKSIKACCRNCNGDDGPDGRLTCAARRHSKPAFDRSGGGNFCFSVPAREAASWGPCTRCAHEFNANSDPRQPQSRPCCRFCGRFLRAGDTAVRIHRYEIVVCGRKFVAEAQDDHDPVFDTGAIIAHVKSAVQAAGNAAVDVTKGIMFTLPHTRDSSSGDCSHGCAHAADFSHIADKTVWIMQMNRFACVPDPHATASAMAPVVRSCHMPQAAAGAVGAFPAMWGDFALTAASVVANGPQYRYLIDGVREEGQKQVVKIGVFRQSGNAGSLEKGIELHGSRAKLIPNRSAFLLW